MISEDAFEALAAQTGPPLSAARKATIPAVWPALQAMMDRMFASPLAEALEIGEIPKWGNLEKPSLTMPFNLTGFPAMADG